MARELGDEQSHYLLEQFIPGQVYHVDGIVSESQVLFAEAHAYGAPPLNVSHDGGVFTTRTTGQEVSRSAGAERYSSEIGERVTPWSAV